MDRELSPKQRRSGRLRPVRSAVIAIAAVAALGWAGQRYLRPSLERADVRVATVERGPLEAMVSTTGTVVPSTEQTMSSPVSAEVREVFVSLGERVERGQKLLQLDTNASALALGNLEEELALARARMRSQELQLDDGIRQARSRRELLSIDLESRQVRLSRFEELAGEGITSEEERLEALLNVKRTEVELAQTEAEITSLEQRRDAELERLGVEYSILERQRDDQARRVELSTVRAAIDGIVTDLVQDEGLAVAEGQALATITSDDAFRVEASVSDFYGPQLKPHQRARIRSSTSEFEGRLGRILPTADSSRLLLFIELDDPTAPAFHTNLRVDVDIITAEKPDVLQVRRGPGLEGAGIQELYVLDGDSAVKTPVRLGLSERQTVEIVDGLEPGDRVIISDMSAYERLSEIRIR